jgi:hypothetical protein
LLDWQRRKWRPVYPYPFLDSLGNEKTNKAWKAVYLENEYLKVTVLPELGGHVYQIFDKTLKRDVIYSNPVMKYAMVALRGAWVSGGIEWNFPDGHTLTTVAPIDYVIRTEADGSAAVAVGDTERVQGMQWQVILRLRPGTRVLESEVTLNNRRVVPGRYWYWSTAGAPAAPDLRFNYPMREAYPHAFWPVFKFPLEKGVDIGRFSEVPNFLSCLHVIPGETISASIMRSRIGAWSTSPTIANFPARRRGRGALMITATSGSISSLTAAGSTSSFKAAVLKLRWSTSSLHRIVSNIFLSTGMALTRWAAPGMKRLETQRSGSIAGKSREYFDCC